MPGLLAELKWPSARGFGAFAAWREPELFTAEVMPRESDR